MTNQDAVYPARVAARSHSVPSIGWSQGTVLFLDVERAPNDEGLVSDPSKGFDVTRSMVRLLEQKARERGIDYSAPTYPDLACDGLPQVGGGPLAKAAIVAEGDDYVVTLPDGRKENVGDEVKRLLETRLDLIQSGHPENPRMGSVLPKMSHRFVLAPPGGGRRIAAVRNDA